jgi:hypothetical protein
VVSQIDSDRPGTSRALIFGLILCNFKSLSCILKLSRHFQQQGEGYLMRSLNGIWRSIRVKRLLNAGSAMPTCTSLFLVRKYAASQIKVRHGGVILSLHSLKTYQRYRHNKPTEYLAPSGRFTSANETKNLSFVCLAYIILSPMKSFYFMNNFQRN